MFQVWKGTCQWLMRYEYLKNFVVKLYSECDLIFFPLSPPNPDSEVWCFVINGYVMICLWSKYGRVLTRDHCDMNV